MNRKSIMILFAGMLLVMLSLSYSHASTTTVNLDGIANAGYSADDLTSTYLNIKNTADSSYYYQWRYGISSALPWSNMDQLVADMNTKGFSWWLESGGDPFNNPSSPIWTSVYLEKGLYEIRLAPDSSAYNLEAYWGDNSWNAYVQMQTSYGESFNFGEGSYVTKSKDDTLDYYHANVDGKTFAMKEDANVYFYINDYNSIDNSGSVKLNIAVVPEPRQVFLFIAGAIPLFVWQQRRKVLLVLKRAVHRV